MVETKNIFDAIISFIKKSLFAVRYAHGAKLSRIQLFFSIEHLEIFITTTYGIKNLKVVRRCNKGFGIVAIV